MGNNASVDDKGTELEQLQEAQNVQDDIFSDAFEAAAKINDEEGQHIDDHSLNTDKKDQHDHQQKGQELNNASKDKSGIDNGADGDDAGKDTKTNVNSHVKDGDDTYEQRWKSLQGILKSKDDKYESEKAQLLSELETLRSTVASLSEQAKKKKNNTDKSDNLFDDLTEEEKAELSEYEKDFDSVSKMEGLKRERALKKLEDRILEAVEAKTAEIHEKIASRVQPIEESFQENDERTHFQSIHEAHEDFETYRDDGSIMKWIESKPRYIQESMKATYAEGKAEDVIDLITDFKLENGLLTTDTDDSSKDKKVEIEKQRAEKKQNLSAVITKRGSVNVGKGRADDFDSSFDEALALLK